jgi:hypothetical protein
VSGCLSAPDEPQRASFKTLLSSAQQAAHEIDPEAVLVGANVENVFDNSVVLGGGNPLAYEWHFINPSTAAWIVVEATDTNITDTLDTYIVENDLAINYWYPRYMHMTVETQERLISIVPQLRISAAEAIQRASPKDGPNDNLGARLFLEPDLRGIVDSPAAWRVIVLGNHYNVWIDATTGDILNSTTESLQRSPPITSTLPLTITVTITP